MQPICEADSIEVVGEECVVGCVENPPSDREREELLAMSCEAYQDNACADEHMRQSCACPDPVPTLGGPCETEQAFKCK